VEEVLAKAHRPDDLAKRIVQSRRGESDELIPVPEDE
jgi:twitching motility protein PilT